MSVPRKKLLIGRVALVGVLALASASPAFAQSAGVGGNIAAFMREVILVTQAEQDIPFDLRHPRYIRYLNNGEGRVALTAALQGRLQTILGH